MKDEIKDNKRFWKDGRRKTKDNYIEIYSPHHPNKNKNNCVMEHRLVMEKYLGRFLTKKEVVHHINKNKQDNNIENLELFSSVGKHTQTHHIVRDSKGKFKKKSEGCGKTWYNSKENKMCECRIDGLCEECSPSVGCKTKKGDEE